MFNDGLDDEQAAYIWILDVLKNINHLDTYTEQVCLYLNSKYNTDGYSYSSDNNSFRINYYGELIWDSEIMFGLTNSKFFITLKNLIINQERLMKLKCITENVNINDYK